MKDTTLETIVSWAKRRGFVYQTSDIYGGLANNYDYGPYGTLLKNNIRDLWWKLFVQEREDMVGLDGAILMQGKVWEASGHVENFTDPLVEDKISHKRYRADHLLEEWAKKNNEEVNVEKMSLEEMAELINEKGIKSPDGNELTAPKTFNLMFETKIGSTADEKDAVVYLRPETAQSIFVNFKNVTDSMRVKVPFGIAQAGKAFRNEITKGQFIFRTIETEQMEIEYFIHPKAEWEKMFEEWLKAQEEFYYSIGAKKEKVRRRQHEDEERSHYSLDTYDLEYKFDFGWKEICGLANRTDFDLKKHSEFTGKKLEYRDPNTNELFIPHVLEPTFGLARAVLVAMYAAYSEEELGEGKMRTVLKFPAKIAPIKAAVFPLQKDEKLRGKAREIYDVLKSHFMTEFDDAGNIGKMYRRQDEIGTPFCITVDFDSLEDDMVTVRDRDTMKQERVSILKLVEYLNERLG
jgi:glycyl-tRNA synthetase